MLRHPCKRLILLVVSFGTGVLLPSTEAAWKRHTIDNSAQGADGVRLGDINRDGRADIATGWEEGGIVRVYLHPGRDRVRECWPAVTVGKVASPEDAVFADVNRDGVLDVISSCEGRNRSAYFHLAPSDRSQILDSSAWKTMTVSTLAKQQMWMYALPLGKSQFEIPVVIVGSKGSNGTITQLRASEASADVNSWVSSRIIEAGWIMSLIAADMDGDSDLDVLASDRKGVRQGVFWLENRGPVDGFLAWKEHRLGLEQREVMFIDYADWNRDGRNDVVAAVKPRSIYVLEQPLSLSQPWKEHSTALPDTIGRAKSVRAADVNLDGRLDLLFSCEGAERPKPGVVWLPGLGDGALPHTDVRDISGPEGVKFDRIETIDLDGDGDIDVLTCEEAENLGVIWYENPARN